MNAAELYRIVEGVPEAALPPIMFADLKAMVRNQHAQGDWPVVPHPKQDMIDSFVGAMGRYLIRRDGELYVNKAGTRFRVESSPGEVQSFDTEVQALAAACKEAK